MTLFIIILTSFVSITAFSRKEIFNKFQLNPYQIYHKKQYFRVISHGFLHADWLHLIINMIVLYSFGTAVENYFQYYFSYPLFYFIIFYLLAIIISSLVSVFKHKNNYYYNAVGASGAVSAIVFASIFFNPWQKVYFYGIIGLPGIILGVLYLLYSYYMGKKSKDNINHDAHFIGAIFGFIFPMLLDHNLYKIFTSQIFHF
ncbi:MAG: rhomboid family intramembrane serine protease [Chlorobi bacterium]|nr:rhomboid family intramembrane serine protease [Chlorobiota bacterium]